MNFSKLCFLFPIANLCFQCTILVSYVVFIFSIDFYTVLDACDVIKSQEKFLKEPWGWLMQYNFTLKCTYEVKYLDEVKFDDPKVILAVSNIFFNIIFFAILSTRKRRDHVSIERGRSRSRESHGNDSTTNLRGRSRSRDVAETILRGRSSSRFSINGRSDSRERVQSNISSPGSNSSDKENEHQKTKTDERFDPIANAKAKLANVSNLRFSNLRLPQTRT